jgi:hypothetical protein
LGTATKIDKVEIQWPDGVRETLNIPITDKTLTIVEGKGAVK